MDMTTMINFADDNQTLDTFPHGPVMVIAEFGDIHNGPHYSLPIGVAPDMVDVVAMCEKDWAARELLIAQGNSPFCPDIYILYITDSNGMYQRVGHIDADMVEVGFDFTMTVAAERGITLTSDQLTELKMQLGV